MPIVTRIIRAGVIINPRLNSFLPQKLAITSTITAITVANSAGYSRAKIILRGKPRTRRTVILRTTLKVRSR